MRPSGVRRPLPMGVPSCARANTCTLRGSSSSISMSCGTCCSSTNTLSRTSSSPSRSTSFDQSQTSTWKSPSIGMRSNPLQVMAGCVSGDCKPVPWTIPQTDSPLAQMQMTGVDQRCEQCGAKCLPWQPGEARAIEFPCARRQFARPRERGVEGRACGVQLCIPAPAAPCKAAPRITFEHGAGKALRQCGAINAAFAWSRNLCRAVTGDECAKPIGESVVVEGAGGGAYRAPRAPQCFVVDFTGVTGGFQIGIGKALRLRQRLRDVRREIEQQFARRGRAHADGKRHAFADG